MNDILYAGGARPLTNINNGGTGGDVDTSGLLKRDVSNLTESGRLVISSIAANSISLDNLSNVDLSNLTAKGQERIESIAASSVDLSGLSDKNLSNITTTGKAVIADIAIESVDLSGLAKNDLSNIAAGLFYGSESDAQMVKFSNGLILQWGATTWGAGNSKRIVSLYAPYTTYYRGFAIANSDTATASSQVMATSVTSNMAGLTVAKSAAATSASESFTWFTIGF